jgi:hypothetical protein
VGSAPVPPFFACFGAVIERHKQALLVQAAQIFHLILDLLDDLVDLV